MSEQRTAYRIAHRPDTATVELRLLGEPLAVETLEAWLEERLEITLIRERPSRKTAGHVLRYFAVKVG